MPKTQLPRPRKVENPRRPFERHVPGIRYGMLERVGTNAEVDAALAALAGGGTYEDLIASILASPEYADRLL